MTLPLTDAARAVLARVNRNTAVSKLDVTEVLFLVNNGFMHSNPVHVRDEICPYKLTAQGTQALEKK